MTWKIPWFRSSKHQPVEKKKKNAMTVSSCSMNTVRLGMLVCRSASVGSNHRHLQSIYWWMHRFAVNPSFVATDLLTNIFAAPSSLYWPRCCHVALVKQSALSFTNSIIHLRIDVEMEIVWTLMIHVQKNKCLRSKRQKSYVFPGLRKFRLKLQNCKRGFGLVSNCRYLLATDHHNPELSQMYRASRKT